jgi:CubicO group peptidase (beta-lactamase class C family)
MLQLSGCRSVSLAALAGLCLAMVPGASAFEVEVAPATPPSSTVLVPIPPGQVDAAVGRLDALAADILARSGIPGMAVAVVTGGKTVYARGFGVRQAGDDKPVDVDTVFQLASLSKPVGATVVASQVSRGMVAWDTPVIEHLPWLALADDWVTRHVTIGDLYAHRSGLPDHAGDQLEDLGYERQDILERLRYAPLGPFRAQYAYTNFGVTLGAEAAAAAAHLDWATLSEHALYQPLGMTVTSSRFEDFMARDNRAAGHVLENGAYVAAHQRQPDAQSPAGGVSSSVSDMAKWLAMVLQNGQYEGKAVITADALLPALSAQMVASPPATPADRAGSYGYGFNVGVTAAGRTILSHSGAFLLGASTHFMMIPSADTGIVVLTNAAPTGAAEALGAEFADLVQVGQVTRDWYGGYSKLMAALETPFGSLVGQAPPANPAPAAALNAYVGSYENPYYGTARIERTADALVLHLGPNGSSYPLRHWDGNRFVFSLFGENAAPGSISALTFRPAPGSAFDTLQIEYFSEDQSGGVFVRR